MGLALRHRVLGARVFHHLELGGVHLIALGHFHGVGTGQNKRAFDGAKCRARRRRHGGSFQPHRPGGAVQPAMLAAADGVEQLALLVENFDFHVAVNVAAALVVSNERTRRTAGTNESLIALRPRSIGVDVLHRRPAGDEGRSFRHQVGSQST